MYFNYIKCKNIRRKFLHVFMQFFACFKNSVSIDFTTVLAIFHFFTLYLYIFIYGYTAFSDPLRVGQAT